MSKHELFFLTYMNLDCLFPCDYFGFYTNIYKNYAVLKHLISYTELFIAFVGGCKEVVYMYLKVSSEIHWSHMNLIELKTLEDTSLISASFAQFCLFQRSTLSSYETMPILISIRS
jgi:hypothetical protein